MNRAQSGTNGQILDEWSFPGTNGRLERPAMEISGRCHLPPQKHSGPFSRGILDEVANASHRGADRRFRRSAGGTASPAATSFSIVMTLPIGSWPARSWRSIRPSSQTTSPRRCTPSLGSRRRRYCRARQPRHEAAVRHGDRSQDRSTGALEPRLGSPSLFAATERNPWMGPMTSELLMRIGDDPGKRSGHSAGSAASTASKRSIVPCRRH